MKPFQAKVRTRTLSREDVIRIRLYLWLQILYKVMYHRESEVLISPLLYFWKACSYGGHTGLLGIVTKPCC